ncbi:MAG: type II toxin-antitoxin system VapC family toxin [Anaerolineae bacterium]|nr:type II toxin-antitoxin system VapC family toxin [Anaerolineae bacterium]
MMTPMPLATPSPSSLFIDTSGWLSIFVPSERFHQSAQGIYAEAVSRAKRAGGITIVTTNYVLSELIALVLNRGLATMSRALIYVRSIRSTSYVAVVHIDKPTDDQAWNLLEKRTDKEWSLVDAASFVVMEHLGLEHSLTTDRHFEQAGFTYLLK